MAEFLRSLSVATHTYTHTHTPAPDNRRLCPHWRGDGKELRSHTHTHTHTQTYTDIHCSGVLCWWGTNLIQDVRLSLYRPYLGALHCYCSPEATVWA